MSFPFRLRAVHHRRWAWGAVAMSILVCGVISWLHLQQRDTLIRAMKALETMRQARIELAQGFLAATLDRESSLPTTGRGDAVALLHQALDSFDLATVNLGSRQDSTTSFHDKLRVFEAQLTRLNGRQRNIDPQVETELRIAYHQLEQEAGRLDQTTRQRVQYLIAHQDAMFAWLLAGAALLLGGVCLAVAAAGRAHALSESALRRWADAFEFCAHGIAIGDPVTERILVCNPAFANLHGRLPAEVAGLPILAVYAAEEHEMVGRMIAEADRTGQVHYESLMVRADGTVFPAQIDVVTVRNDRRELMYRVATIQDITARKRAEGQLRAAENKFRSLVEQSLIGIYIIEGGYFRYVNPGFAELFGYESPDDLIDRVPVLDLVSPDDRALVAENVRLRIAGREAEMRYDFVGIRRDRTTINVEVHGRSFDYQGKAAVIGVVLDITARKQREEALQRFELLVSHSRDVIFFIRRGDGQILEANNAAVATYGYRRDELLAMTVKELRAPALQELTDGHMADADAGGVLFETVHLRRDGTIFPVEVSSQGATIGGTRMLISVVRDISERKRAEESLRESEARLRLFVEYAPASLAMFDRQMRYLVVSRRWLADYNLGERDLTGLSHYDVFPEIPDRWKQVHGRALAGEVVTADADRFERADGSVQWLRWEVRPWHGVRGEVAGVVVFSEDITASVQAQQALRAGAERLRRAEEIAHFGHWRRDLANDRLVWSDELYRIFGLDKESFSPSRESYLRYIHPDDLETFRRDRDSLPPQGRGRFGARIIRPDGETRYLDGVGEIERDESGKAVASFGTLQDVTELRNKERELQEKNAELERFTYMISHDLRSPLVTVKTFLGYLRSDLLSGNGGQIEKDMLYMATATDRMGQLLDELLEMSRIGRLINPPTDVTFRELAGAAVNLVAGQIAERGVAVRIAEAAVTLCGDRARLVEIWQNLVENAVKFMGSQAVPQIEIGAVGEGRETTFFVRDNGGGIDPRFHEKIFGLFEKLDAGSTGTGLGLALVRRIVELYQGKIWVESTGEGGGATFRFTLPEAFKRVLRGDGS